MAKKKKKDDGLREFEIIYIRSGFSMDLKSSQRAIDKHDAILKFKQSNPNTKVKDAKEVIKPPDIETNNVKALLEIVRNSAPDLGWKDLKPEFTIYDKDSKEKDE